MTKDEAQRSRWTFYEVVSFSSLKTLMTNGKSDNLLSIPTNFPSDIIKEKIAFSNHYKIKGNKSMTYVISGKKSVL
ncbi:MAG: hypothetical protein JRI87_09330 [Deltaproteobacteria bacterium]|nr:hypothetical protein [Deltaproteobacteria bacterium]